jgi:large subunit ribosomal protein L20
MVRIKRGNVAIKRRKKILNFAKGFQGTHSQLFRIANQQVMKSLIYSYNNRKQKKRQFRKLWILRINSAARQNKTKYSHFIHNLKQSRIILNRKMLAQLSILDPMAFQNLVVISKA